MADPFILPSLETLGYTPPLPPFPEFFAIATGNAPASPVVDFPAASSVSNLHMGTVLPGIARKPAPGKAPGMENADAGT
jgi:hypothetical protein